MPTPSELASQLEQFDDDQWYEFLDRLDEVSRRRRQSASDPRPAGTSRAEVAAWLASKHLVADSGIREVWYLPTGAPPNEIRLLELNDRLAGTEGDVAPIDFGLDIEGLSFGLLIADVTTDQLTAIVQDPSKLPPGWSLDGRQVWRRGE